MRPKSTATNFTPVTAMVSHPSQHRHASTAKPGRGNYQSHNQSASPFATGNSAQEGITVIWRSN
ncbi:hypothetical protein E2C01_090605 [Portunus trituberculatus]|uniref:Uncharacterized protein n=1 Tax=Portunus trituberculatus TaxID=210409 RepID=A0A5B7JM75_PORTR|nr:hypothetical protein [Portunus trituberculatus]